MEDIKEKLPMFFAGIVAILICVLAVYFIENYEGVYYTKIDNTRIEKLSSSDDMKYEYTLESYDENGKKKDISFKTNRELREGAYLKLKLRIFGVFSWEEVQLNELPEKVQLNYN